MIGAGGQAGQGDAANLLKPALARGELRTIAATTWAEYKKYFEKDAALARRFQVVKVEEPDREDSACVMMRGVVPTLEKHHNVRILDEGGGRSRQALAPLIPGPAAAGQGRQPARHRLRPRGDRAERHSARRSRTATRRSTISTVQTRILERETATGADHAERLAGSCRSRRPTRQASWPAWRRAGRRKRELVAQIREIRTQLEAAARCRSAAERRLPRSGRAGSAAAAAPMPKPLRAELDQA